MTMRRILLPILVLLALFALVVATGPPGVASAFAGVAPDYDCYLLAPPADLTLVGPLAPTEPVAIAITAPDIDIYYSITPAALTNAPGYAIAAKRQEVTALPGYSRPRFGPLASANLNSIYGILANRTAISTLVIGTAPDIIRA